jgi:Retrotransposon gag protein
MSKYNTRSGKIPINLKIDKQPVRERSASDSTFNPAGNSTSISNASPFARSNKLSHSPPKDDFLDPFDISQRENIDLEKNEDVLVTENVPKDRTAGSPTIEEQDNIENKEESKENPENTQDKTQEEEEEEKEIRIDMANTTLQDARNNQRNPATPKFLCPPTFDPCNTSADHFIKQYERTSAANGWDNALKMQYLGSFLEGAADLWFKRYADKPENLEKTWTDLKKDFCKEFEGLDSTKHLEKKLLERKQKPDESLRTYFYELQNIFGEYDETYNLTSFKKYFENGLDKSYYANYRLLLEEDSDWDDYKKIINKLDDIKLQEQATSSSNNGIHQEVNNPSCQCKCSQPAGYDSGNSYYPPRQYIPKQNYQRYPGSNGFNGNFQRQSPRYNTNNWNNYRGSPNRYRNTNGPNTYRQFYPQSQQGNMNQTYHNSSYRNYNQTDTGRGNNRDSNKDRYNYEQTRHHDGRPKCQICHRIGHSATTCRQNPNEGGRHK